MKVVLTIDTEPSIAGAFSGNPAYTPLIHEPVAGEVNGQSEALGFLLKTLRWYGLVATFFVETVHTWYFPKAIMAKYVDQLMRAGQDVQLHIHPCWLAFAHADRAQPGHATDSCRDLETTRLADLIAHGAELIRDWTGAQPNGMRTGNFSSGMSVFEAIKQAGLVYSSNICLAVDPPPEPALAVTGGVHDFAGIRELPVTCFADVGPIGRGSLRPLQITALSARELISLLDLAHAVGNPVAVIVTHPFEFLKKRDFRYTALRPNRLVQGRLRRLCAFLAANGDRFEVLPLAAAGKALDPSRQWTELAGRRVHSIARAVENVINDRLPFL